jgi:hypothetical protein
MEVFTVTRFYLVLPEALFLRVAKTKEELEGRIAKDINSVHNVQNEYIDKVFLELEVTEDSNWREESGALLQGIRLVSEEATNRIWAESQYRPFLSHKSEAKTHAAELRDKLSRLGVSCFVAHTDIYPTREWQDEIENALASMDGFVALMTERFHDSDWTDQEMGYAFARGVPIIAVRLGTDPYGFIAKFQGLSCKREAIPIEIVKLLMKSDRMFDSYLAALRGCGSFDRGNLLADILPAIKLPTPQQIEAIVDAYNSNTELQGSFGFNGRKSGYYGPGLVTYLNNWSDQRYLFDGYDVVKGKMRSS